ncbi:MAG: aminoacyl-tRNA hydrolase [Burkholderiaceae bacterium]
MTPSIQLFVGLGNPGPRYQDHRHNVGFWLTERLQNLPSALTGFSPSGWQEESRFSCRLQRLAPSVFCCQPTTYMNESGQAVRALVQFYKIPTHAILVVHDELDIPPGDIRLKKGGGHGGHNGIRSIAQHLGTSDFWRLRLGIGHPRSLGLQQEVADFVLHRPSAAEQALIQAAIDRSLQAIPDILNGRFDKAQLALHSPT